MPEQLLIIERASPGAVETQFADVLYVARELCRQLGDTELLLRADAVTAAVEAVPTGLLAVGDTPIAVADDRNSIRALLGDGVTVHVDTDDLGALGIGPDRLLPGVHPVAGDTFAREWDRYRRVWFL
jgi:hypothetical protein